MPNGCLKQRGSPQGPRRYDIRRDTHPASTDIAAPAEADPAEESTGADDGVDPDFKQAIDSYIAFFEEYCEFIEAYANNPTDLELLGQLGDMMEQSATMSEEFSQLDQAPKPKRQQSNKRGVRHGRKIFEDRKALQQKHPHRNRSCPGGACCGHLVHFLQRQRAVLGMDLGGQAPAIYLPTVRSACDPERTHRTIRRFPRDT